MTEAHVTLTPSARAHCPECPSTDVVDLYAILYSPRVDFFQCRSCGCLWTVPKHADGPATRGIEGDPVTAHHRTDKAS